MHIFGHTWLKIYQFVVKPGSACKNFMLIHPSIPASYYQTKYSKICWPHQILTKPKLVSACKETSWLVNIAILTILQYACPFLEYHLPKNYQIIIFSLNNWYPRAKKSSQFFLEIIFLSLKFECSELYAMKLKSDWNLHRLEIYAFYNLSTINCLQLTQ